MCGGIINGFFRLSEKAMLMKIFCQISYSIDARKSFLIAKFIQATFKVQFSYQKNHFPSFNNSILEYKKLRF